MLLDAPSPFGRLAAALSSDWRVVGRPSQQTPPGDFWSVWVILAGRGWGKTRTGAEFLRTQRLAGCRRLALVGATAADVRDVMIEGESGVLATSPNHDRPEYEPSKRRLTWSDGTIATAYSADEPDRLRGPQHDAAWCDELASWKYPDAFTMLQLGLRLGKHPRTIVTTTPKPVKLIRDLLAREGEDVIVTRGSTYENRPNLAPSFFSQIVRQYEGSRLGRQELNAELLDDVPGALWQHAWIDCDRVSSVPELKRVVVAIDPAVTSGEEADETGIVVCGVGKDGQGYVLEDISGRYQPHEWAATAIAAYRKHRADKIIGEVNNGGEMIGVTIRTLDNNVPFKPVHATRGKVMRAEPIATLYEQGRVHHVGSFPKLEDQACSFSIDFDRARMGYSPDRLDALVWALTELMTGYPEPDYRIPVPIQVCAGPSEWYDRDV